MAAGLTVATVLGFAVFAGPGTGVASASSGTLVIDELGCRLLDGNGQITYPSSSHVVITESANGNRVLKCSVKGVSNFTARAAHFDREHRVSVFSKAGNATLTCLVP